MSSNGEAERLDLVNASDFGAIDADADALVRDCFQDHTAYLEARDLQRFLILGRKGSGKTAIYKRFIGERSPNAFSFGHSFDDYPWHHHDLQAQSGVPEERRYIHSWKYLVLLSLSKLLLNQDQSQPWSEQSLESVSALEAFVVDSYGSRDPDVSQLFSPERELRFKAGFHLPFLDFSGERVRIRELPTHIQEVNRAVQEHVLRSLNPNNTYYICFDQLDLDFTTTSPEYANRLIGLILAARDLFIASRSADCRLNIIVFLRDDIYQDLQFEDKNKITESFATYVRWSEILGELTLKRLMESRFSRVLGNNSNITWADVFDETRNMPGRQTKYRHICDRTFLRPRDMIKFCNEVLRAYQGSYGGDSQTKFDNSSIHTARESYSYYLLSELDDEVAKHVPEYKEYLEVLKELGAEKFSMDSFRAAWERRHALDRIEATTGLKRLFEFSVVGYLKPGGRSGGSEYVWQYIDPRARFSSNADTYRVHPGFKEALDLTRTAA